MSSHTALRAAVVERHADWSVVGVARGAADVQAEVPGGGMLLLLPVLVTVGHLHIPLEVRAAVLTATEQALLMEARSHLISIFCPLLL